VKAVFFIFKQFVFHGEISHMHAQGPYPIVTTIFSERDLAHRKASYEEGLNPGNILELNLEYQCLKK